MAFNLVEFQQKQDQLIYTIDEIVEWMRKVAGQTGYAQLQYYDKNGNLVTKNVPTIPELIENFRQGVNSQMSKTFYVDQVNGSDTTGDGSQNAPFQSIKKAIDSVPAGGYGIINILGDYVFAEQVNIINKVIHIILRGTLSVDWEQVTIGTTVFDRLKGTFYLGGNGYLVFEISSGNNGKMIIQDRPATGNALHPVQRTLIVSKQSNNAVRFDLKVSVDNYNPIYIGSSAFLAGVYTWGNNRGTLSFVLVGHYAGTNRSVVINDPTTSGLLDTRGFPCEYVVLYDGGFADGAGTALNPATLVTELIKDANGVPRNIISNVVL